MTISPFSTTFPPHRCLSLLTGMAAWTMVLWGEDSLAVAAGRLGSVAGIEHNTAAACALD